VGFGARGQTRQRFLRRMALAAGILAVLTLLFLITGHWFLAIVFGVAAFGAVWLIRQLRTVR